MHRRFPKEWGSIKGKWDDIFEKMPVAVRAKVKIIDTGMIKNAYLGRRSNEIETGRIPGVQDMFSIACFIQASSMLTTFIVDTGRNDTWLVVLLGFLSCSPLLLIYLGLMRRFPDLSLAGVNNAVFGPVAGKIVTVLYLWFFLTLTSLNLRDMTNFINLAFLPLTPARSPCGLYRRCALAVYPGLKR